MIRYALTCEAGHGFESWFASDAAYATLAKAGQVGCPVCGSVSVTKSLMAPAVRPARKAEAARAKALAEVQGKPPEAAASTQERPALSVPDSDLERALAELRRQVETNSEYVGMNFAAEARRIHDGDAPERSIYGEAKPEEARKLLEDGVPVAPLPFLPSRKAN